MRANWLLQGASSAERRQMYIDWHLLPCLRELARGAPESVEVLVCVAQFWNDEANDEVHVVPLLLDKPWHGQWPPPPPDAITMLAGQDKDWWFYLEYDPLEWEDELGFRRIVFEYWVYKARSLRWEAEERSWRPKLDTLSPVPALAPYCRPAADQEQASADVYSPALLVTLSDWSLRWVGEVLQPELEDHLLCNTIRAERERMAEGPLERIPLDMLALVPEIEAEVRGLVDAVLAFVAQERAGGVGDERGVAAFREWASVAHRDNSDILSEGTAVGRWRGAGR